MKMFLTEDEWYPVLGFSTEDRPYLRQLSVEASPELVKEWKEALLVFEAVQEKIAKLPTTKIPPTENLW